MTGVPLPKGIVGIDATPKAKESLTNLFLHENHLIQVPGVEFKQPLTIISDASRGAVNWTTPVALEVSERIFYVSGDSLFSIVSPTSSPGIKGTVEGTADCVFAVGFNFLVVIVKGGKGYSLSAGGSQLEEITTNYLPSDSVDYIDGRFVFVPTDGSPVFYSEIDDPQTILALNFFDAEELPDSNRFVINVSNQLYIAGTESTEIFRTTADANNPFIRRSGGRVDVGYTGGGLRFLGSYAFIGRRRGEAFQIYFMQSGNVATLSNSAINEILNRDYTETELRNVNAFTFEWMGQPVIGWNLPDRTICYSAGNWFYMDSGVDSVVSQWRGRDVVFGFDRYFVGDNTGNELGQYFMGFLDDIPTFWGDRFEYEMQTFIRSVEKTPSYSLKSLELDCLTGQKYKDNDGDFVSYTIGLSLSRDGRGYSDYSYRDLGVTGEYNIRIRWAGGLGRYDSLTGIKIRGTGDVKFSTEGLEAEIK